MPSPPIFMTHLLQLIINTSGKKPHWWGMQCAIMFGVIVILRILFPDERGWKWYQYLGHIGLILVAVIDYWIASQEAIFHFLRSIFAWMFFGTVLGVTTTFAFLTGDFSPSVVLSILLYFIFWVYERLKFCKPPPPPKPKHSLKRSLA